MKQCSTCKELKPKSEFAKNRTKSDGLHNQCKECKKQQDKQYRADNKAKLCEYRKQYYVNNKEQIIDQTRQYYVNNKDWLNERKKQYWSDNKAKFSEQRKEFRTNSTEKYLLNAARKRANKRGLEFNLELSDIILPEFCPVLGLKLEVNEGKPRDNSPSLDRIDSSKGYIKGNIEVISWRANRLKSDATLEEMKRIVAYYENKSKEL